MLTTYFKITWRNLAKSRLFTTINILGLAIGLASFIVMLVYFNYEMSYDRWHPSLNTVYKVGLREDHEISSTTPAPLASLLSEKYAHAQAATAIMPAGDFEVLLSVGEKTIYQKGLVTVDSCFLKVFPYKLIEGDAATALNPSNAVILSQEVSHKLFGDESPIGKTLKFYNVRDYLVTGILQQPEGPSHLNVQLLMRDPNEQRNKFWQNHSYQTYIKLSRPLASAAVEKDLDRIYYEAQLKKDSKTFQAYKTADHGSGLFVDAIRDLHNFPQHGETHFKVTIILLVLAVFLLAAGAINFSNLSLARAITRAKEVGVRKVLGSSRSQIIFHALFEIAVQCLISLALAIFLVSVLLPWLGRAFDLPLSFLNGRQVLYIALQIAACLGVIIIVSGLYPAMFLSRYRASEVLKGKYSHGTKGQFFRNSLLLVQLTLSALFVTGIIVINRQMEFMQHRDLGFNATQVIRIEALQSSREDGFALVRNSLLSVPGVEYVSKSTAVPGNILKDTGTAEFRLAGKKIRCNTVKVGTDFFRTMDIRLINGRSFDDSHPEDRNNTAVINESAMRAAGITDPVGRLIYFPGCDSLPYTVVGVVKDFNVLGLDSRIQPAVYSISNAHCGYQSGGAVLVKVRSDHVQQTLAGISTAWKKLEPAFPIRYSFLHQNFARSMVSYTRLEKVIAFFSIICVLIAITGLFALTSFLARQRIKEIGIRKVLGATVANLTGLLSRDFVRLLVLAILISTPISWWALSHWLNDFAYRIELSWWMFVLAAICTIGITLITVCSRAIKAARANPVDSLRSE